MEEEIGDIWLILDSMRDLKGQGLVSTVDLAFGNPPNNSCFVFHGFLHSFYLDLLN